MDLLGKRVKTYKCAYRVEGIVVGETYGTFLLLVNGKVVTVPKRPCWFFIDGVLVNGSQLVGYRDVRLLSTRRGPPELCPQGFKPRRPHNDDR